MQRRKRMTLLAERADNFDRAAKRIFEMVKTVGAANHAEVLGGPKAAQSHPVN